MNPGVHYFFAERLAIGGDLMLNYTKYSDDNSWWAIGVGPSVTYYFGAPAATLHPYLSARAAIASISFDTPLGDTDGSRRTISAAAGILTMLSRSVGMKTELFYLVGREEAEPVENDFNAFGLAVGIAAFVF